MGRIVLVNAALILAVIALAEGIFGGWFRDNTFDVLNIPRNVHYKFDVTEAYGRDEPAVYTRDKLGFRGPYVAPEEIDMIVLGGSTTNEYYVDDAETWVALTNRELRRTFPGFTMANGGIDGQSSRGHRIAIERWISRIDGLAPDYVLVFLGINEPLVEPESISAYDEMLATDKGRRTRHFIMNNSALYTAFRTVRGHLRASRVIHSLSPPASEMSWRPANGPSLDEVRDGYEKRISAYKDRLSRLTDAITALGAAPVFVTQRFPNTRVREGKIIRFVRKDGPPPVTHDVHQLALMNRATLTHCERRALFCIDLAADVEFQAGDFYDPVHTTPSGSRRIAAGLAPHLSRLLTAR